MEQQAREGSEAKPKQPNGDVQSVSASASVPGGWDAFLSHHQSSSDSLVLALREAALAARAAAGQLPLRFWYDQDEEASLEGMQRGVEGSAVFVLFAAPQLLCRPAVQFEVKAALRARKPIVVVAPAGAGHSGARCDAAAALAEAVAGGRAFSADPSKRADGLVHLEDADFDALVAAVAGTTAVVAYEQPPRLVSVTVPAFLAAVTAHAAAAAAADFEPAALPEPLFRMRKAVLPSDLSVDALIIAPHRGQLQASFLAAALGGSHMCARRTARVAVLDVGASEEEAVAAVRHAHSVVVVLTADVWNCRAVRHALTAVTEAEAEAGASTAQRSLSQRAPTVALLHEPDERYGGCAIGKLIEDTPVPLRPLFAGHIARPLDRQRDKRALLLAWLLDFIGAVRCDSVGGSLPPPALPPQYDETAVLATLRNITSVLAGRRGYNNNPRAVSTGGPGGAGKTTLASAVAASPVIRQTFDEIFWLTLGHVTREVVLERMQSLVREVEACEAATTTAELNTIEKAAARLQVYLQKRSCLVIVDDAWDRVHFMAFLSCLPPSDSTGGSSCGGSCGGSGAHPSPARVSKLLFTTRAPELFQATVESMCIPPGDAAALPVRELSAADSEGLLARAAHITPTPASKPLFAALFASAGTLPLTLNVVAASLKARLQPLRGGSDAALEGAVLMDMARALKAPDAASASGGASGGAGGAAAAPADATRCWLDNPAFLSALAAGSPSGWEKYLPVHRAMQMALQTLFSPDHVVNFAALGLFTEDSYIPEEVVSALWRSRPEEARQLLQRLSDAGLVKLELPSSGAGAARVMLHDLAHDFAGALCAIQPGGSAGMHMRFLQRLFKAATGRVGPQDEDDGVRRWWYAARYAPAAGPQQVTARYAIASLAHHLAAAGLYDELQSVLLEPQWCAARIARHSVSALLEDVALLQRLAAAQSVPSHQARVPELLRQTIALLHASLQHVEGCGDAAAVLAVLAAQMAGRLRGIAEDHAAIGSGALQAAEGEGSGALRSLNANIKTVQVVLEQHRHPGVITCMCVLPDGRIVTGSDDNNVRVWDAATGNCEHVLAGHDTWVHASGCGIGCLCVLPDGRIVSGGEDNEPRVWDPSTGRTVHVLKGHDYGPYETGGIHCVCALPDNLIVSSGADTFLYVWNAMSGHCQKWLKTSTMWGAFCMCGLRDGRVVSAAEDHTLQVWDAATGKCERVLKGHTATVTCMCMLPDGRLVSGSDDRTLCVWDAATGTCKLVLGLPTDSITHMCVLPDGRLVSGAGDGSLHVWKLDTSSVVQLGRRLPGGIGAIATHGDRVYALAAGQVYSVLLPE